MLTSFTTRRHSTLTTRLLWPSLWLSLLRISPLAMLSLTIVGLVH